MEINEDNEAKQLQLKDKNNKRVDVFVEVKKVDKTPSILFDKRKSKENKIGLMNISGFMLGKDVVGLFRDTYSGHGSCFNLYNDNFITKLPLFCAKLYPQENWWERDVYFTTADKGEEYVADKDFLKKCLIFTCLSQRNYCRTFKGTDGRMYYNELCLLQDTLSDKELAKFELDDEDKKLIAKWQLVLNEAKRLKPDFTKWGLYQIEEELTNKKKSTKKEQTLQFESDDEDFYYGTTQQEITAGSEIVKYDNSNLMNYIKELKDELKTYYKSQIQDKLFEYELLK